MAKTTYILGAGASAQALPINRTFPDALEQLAERLRSETAINPAYRTFQERLCTDLYWLAKMGRDHGTVDTFAKFCSLKDLASLQRLKITLSMYFSLEQFVYKKTDKRYRNFLTKQLDSRQIFPNDIKILNWNYDCQFQIAASSYREEDFTILNSVMKYSFPVIQYYPTLGGEFNINARMDHLDLSMVHLNGIAGYYVYEQTAHLLNYNLGSGGIKDINDLFERVNTDSARKHPIMTFGFEKDMSGPNYYTRKRVPFAKQMIAGTEYLVVVGYSFPPENQEVDQELLSIISTSLKGIYYQDPILSGDEMRRQFQIPHTVFIKHISQNESFHIPVELKLKTSAPLRTEAEK